MLSLRSKVAPFGLPQLYTLAGIPELSASRECCALDGWLVYMVGVLLGGVQLCWVWGWLVSRVHQFMFMSAPDPTALHTCPCSPYHRCPTYRALFRPSSALASIARASTDRRPRFLALQHTQNHVNLFKNEGVMSSKPRRVQIALSSKIRGCAITSSKSCKLAGSQDNVIQWVVYWACAEDQYAFVDK